MSIEYTNMPVDWTPEESHEFYGTVNAKPVTVGNRTFAPEHLFIIQIEYTRVMKKHPTSGSTHHWVDVVEGIAKLAFDYDRPGGWNYYQSPMGWSRVVDHNHRPPYPIKSWGKP